MATPFQPRDLWDSIGPFPEGVNSGVPPILLSRLQASFANNTTFRGSYPTDRPPFIKLSIIWPSDEVQTAVEQGLFQGRGFYRPDFGNSSLFAQISGRLFQFEITGDGLVVTERTIPGDPNPDTTTQVWMWQSENFLIVNDGVSLPIFFDGSTTRRSMGPSIQLQLVFPADFTVPAIGSSVLIGLNAAYTGPFNMPIYIDDALYQAVENANASYNVTLTNLTATAGTPVAIGDEVTAEPVKLGKLTAPTTFNIISGSFAIGTLQLNWDISYPYTGDLNKDILIDGKVWRIFSTTNGGLRIQARNRFVVGPPGINVPAGTLVQLASSPAPNVSLGTVVTGFVTPAQGASTTAELTLAYTGADGASVWLNGEQWTITAIPTPPAGASITVINLTDDPGAGTNTRGPTGNVGIGQLSTVDELPAGRMGAYGMGRNVMSLVDGQSYIISDIVGGGAGTPANSYRDSVLKVTENEYELGGGVFRIPGTAGDIRAIIFPAVLDLSYGQGPCQILTPEKCFSVNVPVDRTDWQTVTNPLQSQSLIANGGQGQDNTIVVDGDIQFRSVDGWRSLVFGRRQFTDPGGNSPMSHEVDRIIALDNIELLSYGSAAYFDNRVIWTASPQSSAQGVIHPAIVAQNLENLASINDKSAPFYDGLWTGLNVLKFVNGKTLGKDKCYAFSLNVPDNRIEIYELLPTGTEHFDNRQIPITWWTESPAMFQEKPEDRSYKQLVDGEIQVDDVQSRVDFVISYKPDQWPCFVPWHRFSICAEQGEGLMPGFYPRMGFGTPTPNNCDTFTNRPLREGYTFQVKVQITGHCRVLAVNLRAVTKPEPKMAPLVPADCVTVECKRLECEVPDDFQVYSLQDGLIFTSGTLSAVVGCPAGYVCDPGVFPHTFVYNPGGWTVPVTPREPPGSGGPIELRLLGCQSMIFRTLPADATSAQIAAAVQSMFVEAAQQQAICDAPTIPGVRPEPPPPPAGAFSMTALTPTTACLSTAYSSSVTASANATFSIIGTLPAGLVLSQGGAIATISGTPTTAGSTVFGIHAVAVSGGATASQQVTFAVVGITTASPLPNANEGDAYSETIVATGMSGTLTWSATGLPAGLSINSATGEISGTPDAGTEGAYSILVTVSNT